MKTFMTLYRTIGRGEHDEGQAVEVEGVARRNG